MVEDGCDHPEERDGGQGCGKRGKQKGWNWKTQRDVSGRDWRSGMACYKAALCWVLGSQPASTGSWDTESSGAIFPKKKKKEKHIPFPSTPEGCCFAGASPEAVMGVRETASGSSAASSPITPPTAWRTMKSLSEIAERRCRNRG